MKKIFKLPFLSTLSYMVFLLFPHHSLYATEVEENQTPLFSHVTSITQQEPYSGIKGIDTIYLINLDERLEKWQRSKEHLENYGLYPNRVSAINGWKLSNEVKKELFGPYPVRISPGHLGCLLSHLSVIKDAYEKNFERIWVMEDEVEIIEGLEKIPYLIQELDKIDPDWDIFYTDTDSRAKGNNYNFARALDPRPDQPLMPLPFFLIRASITDEIQSVRLRYGTYSVILSKRGIKKLFDFFSSHYAWTSIDIDIHLIPHIRQYSAKKDLISNLRDTKESDTGYKSSLNTSNL